MTPAVLLVALLSSPRPAAARATPPPEATVWDQIFASQAAKLMREGMVKLADGDYDGAVQLLARAVVTAPQEPLARVLLGSAYYWQGQVDQAMQEYQEALKLDPDNAQAHQLMGIAYAWKGDVESAYREFGTAAQEEPGRPDVQMNLGSVELTRGRLPQALDRFRAAVRLDPSHPLYHYQLGLLYIRLGREADAQDELESALRLYPAYQDALLELAALRERAGDLSGAQSRFEEAVKLKPRDAVARFRLAEVLLREGRPGEARDALAGAFSVSPSAKEGGRLALSVAYGGKPAESVVPGSGPAGPGAGAPGAASPAAEPPDPVGTLEKNLERIPPGVESKVEIQVAFTPPPQLEPRPPSEGRGSLGRALGQSMGPAGPGPDERRGPMVAKREVILSADPAKRKDQIDSLMKDLRSAMKSVPPGGRAHLGMNVQYQEPTSGAEAAPSLHYEPRRVGNDLGLWVMGTGWMSLVQEVLPDLERAVSRDGGGTTLLAVGLGNLTAGESGPARETFAQATAASPKDVLAYLGLAAASVEAGDEAGAAGAYRKVLDLDPKNKIAKDALEWLKR